MRFKVEFEYEDERFGFEGEQYTVVCQKTRYFRSFNDYQDFLQQIDMAGDEGTRVLETEEISDFKSNIYILRAAFIFFTGGWLSDKRVNKFYDLLEKSLVDYFGMPIARWIDELTYKRHKRERRNGYEL